MHCIVLIMRSYIQSQPVRFAFITTVLGAVCDLPEKIFSSAYREETYHSVQLRASDTKKALFFCKNRKCCVLECMESLRL